MPNNSFQPTSLPQRSGNKDAAVRPAATLGDKVTAIYERNTNIHVHYQRCDSDQSNYSKYMKSGTIHVLGGARGIGRWFAENVFTSSGASVCLYDITPPTIPITIHNATFRRISYDYEGVHGFSSFNTGDVLVLSVPIQEIQRVAENIFPLLPDSTLVVDMSSVKVKTHAVLDLASAGRLSVMGIHPLFGPQVPTPIGQTAALTGYSSNDTHKRAFREMLSAAGLLITERFPDDHDNAMLYVQVLTHFTYLTFASVLSRCPQKLDGLLQLATPPFQILSAFAGRILGSPLTTYANIQRIEGSAEIRQRFIEAALQLNSDLSETLPLDASIQSLASIVKPFTGAEIAQCRALSATAIDSLQVFEQRLFSLVKSARLCGIYRIDTKEVVPCKVAHIKADRIVVDERFVSVEADGGRKYAVAANDIAVRSYRRRGINISQSRQCEMLKRNIRILSDADFDEWMRLNILPITNDINIRTTLMISDVFCETWLPLLIPGIISLEFVDAYRKRGQSEKISLRVVHRPEIDLSELTMKIQALLDQLGALGGIAPTSKSSVK